MNINRLIDCINLSKKDYQRLNHFYNHFLIRGNPVSLSAFFTRYVHTCATFSSKYKNSPNTLNKDLNHYLQNFSQIEVDNILRSLCLKEIIFMQRCLHEKRNNTNHVLNLSMNFQETPSALTKEEFNWRYEAIFSTTPYLLGYEKWDHYLNSQISLLHSCKINSYLSEKIATDKI